MRKPILCIDFDGVIHSYTSGWKGVGVVSDGPVPGAISALLGYLDAGFEVHIYSSRSKSIFGRFAMKRWLGKAIADYWRDARYRADGLPLESPSLVECECWGDATGITRRFKWPWFKPSATVSIDDRGLTFTGTWPTVESLKSFKPWNKR